MNRDEATAKLLLEFKVDDGETYLANQYYNLPLQVLPPHYQDNDGTAFVYLLNPSGGIMQGDRLLTEIDVEENAKVLVTTTASTKYYKSEDDIAVVSNKICLGDNSTVEYMPEHGVPFANSDVLVENTFFLKDSSTFMAFDAVSSGRKARGEHFEYKRYRSKTSIIVDDKLILYDSIDVFPKTQPVNAKGILEDYDIFGTVYLYQKGLAKNICSHVRDSISVAGDMTLGISAVNDDLAVIKILGRSIIDYKESMYTIWDCCRKYMLNKTAVRIRKH